MTLVEIMMVIAIIGVIAIVIPPVLTNSTKVFVLGKAKIELQREARATMYLVTRQLRQAQSNSITIDQGTGQPYYSRVRFTKVPSTSVIIEQQGTSLILTEGIVVSTMTRNLAYLSFTFPRSDDMTIISFALTLQQLIYNGKFKALHMASERIRVMN